MCLKELEALEHLITHSRFQPAARVTEVESAATEYGVTIDESIYEYYHLVHTASVEWEIKSESGILPVGWGRFHIYDLRTVLSGYGQLTKWKGFLWFDWMDEGQQQELSQYRVFDLFNRDESECACLRIDENKHITDTLYLYSLDDGMQPMNMDIKSYIDFLVRAKAWYGWQYAAIDPEGYRAHQLRRHFNKVFPDAELPI